MGSVRRRKRGILFLLCVVIVCLGVFIGYEYYISKYELSVTRSEITTDKIKEPIRIVQLTDLHNSEFGEENEELVSLVKEQEPDLILITGDLLNADQERTDIATHLLEKLVNVAPVYVSYGNHEKDYEIRYGKDLTALFEQTGARVLERRYEDIEVGGQKLRLGGIYGYCVPAKFLETNEADPEECAYLSEFQQTDRYSILLCHMPYAWIENDGISSWDVDCVLAGHTHGGQIRLPLIGGLYAPDQGFFPGREAGLYNSDNHKKVLVLSRGLGSTERIPRWNNVPEVMVVDVKPEE